MSNSPLVNYTKISPNRTSPRNHSIDTITIHCVVGQCTVERLGEVFAPVARQASSNYGVGYDGRIGMYCEEKDRSWCTSSGANDHRAITIEVASDTTHPYAVTEKAYNALIELVADICKRNNIKKLLWKADKSLIGQVDKQNMTVHRWFANKSCPGEFLYSRHADIAEKVNAKLGVVKETAPETPASPTFKVGDTVKVVADYYNPTVKSKIPSWVKDYAHIVTKTTSGGKKVYKGGKECVLLGKRLDKNNKQVAGINTWVAIEALAPYTVPYRTHTVVKGDSLWNIAKKYLGNGARYPEIKELNKLTSNVIYSGQILKIPNK